MENEMSYSEWLATLPLYALHNEYNEVRSNYQSGPNNMDHDAEEKYDALLAEEKQRGISLQVGPEMVAGEEY